MAYSRDKYDELLGFSRNIDRIWSAMLQETRQPQLRWRPPTDVYETDDAVVVLVEVAGMDPEKLEVSFRGKILQIRGRREDRHRKYSCHCLEVEYGEFSSVVYLPGNYDRDAISAEYDDGFLTIRLPKASPEAKSPKIEIATEAD